MQQPVIDYWRPAKEALARVASRKPRQAIGMSEVVAELVAIGWEEAPAIAYVRRFRFQVQGY